MKETTLFEQSVFFLLIVTSFTLSAFDGFSKLSIIFAFLSILLLTIRLGKLFLMKEFIVPLIFLIFNVMSLFWNGDPDYVVQVSSAIVTGYAVFAALKFRMPISVLLWSLAISGILNIIFSDISIQSDTDPSSYESEENRVGGLMGNANGLAILLVYAAFVLYFLSSQRSLWVKGAVFYFIYFTILYTGSRKGLMLSALLLLLMGIDYLLWQKTSNRLRRFMIAFLVVLVFLGFSFKKLSESSQDILAVQRVESMLHGEDKWSTQTRYSMITRGIDLWLEKPLLGWGAGGFTDNAGFFKYAHNNYIEVLANYGFIGFCLYYMFYMSLILKGWRLRHQHLPRVGLSIVIIHIILEWGLVSLANKTTWIFLPIAAYCVYGVDKKSKELI